MGLLSSSVSITQYKVIGEINGNLTTTITEGLKKFSITDIDHEPVQKTVGWTCFESPYIPDFDKTACIIGTYFIFSLRIDKKSIPSKIIKKYYMAEIAKKLAESEREHLSRNEKKTIKDNVINFLSLRIPASPNIYDILWNYEESFLWFFSNQKAANEELETLFSKTFRLKLVRLFPYTMADLSKTLTDKDRDLFNTISPIKFVD
ncbi:MAG: recombination-associated protein RdgC [Pseudomonadota bacterium]